MKSASATMIMKPTEQPLKKSSLRPGWLIVTLLSLAGLAGSGCGQTPTFEAAGTIHFNQKPVYPATLMLRDDQGQILPVSTAADGSFRLFEVRKARYQAAIQTPQLANVGGSRVPVKGDTSPDAEGTREATVPEKFKQANTQIPDRYRDFASSGLSFDFSEEVPQDLVIELVP